MFGQPGSTPEPLAFHLADPPASLVEAEELMGAFDVLIDDGLPPTDGLERAAEDDVHRAYLTELSGALMARAAAGRPS